MMSKYYKPTLFAILISAGISGLIQVFTPDQKLTTQNVQVTTIPAEELKRIGFTKKLHPWQERKERIDRLKQNVNARIKKVAADTKIEISFDAGFVEDYWRHSPVFSISYPANAPIADQWLYNTIKEAIREEIKLLKAQQPNEASGTKSEPSPSFIHEKIELALELKKLNISEGFSIREFYQQFPDLQKILMLDNESILNLQDNDALLPLFGITPVAKREAEALSNKHLFTIKSLDSTPQRSKRSQPSYDRIMLSVIIFLITLWLTVYVSNLRSQQSIEKEIP